MTPKTEEELKNCRLCGGNLEEKTITHPQQYEGKIIILENVPAEVCRNCGDVLIAPSVVKRLQQLVWSKKDPTRTDEVPVYDLAGSF